LGRGLEHGPMGINAVMSVRGTAPVADVIASLTRDVADFPKPGVQFKDLTPLFADRNGMTAVTEALAGIASGADLVAGIESRGFLVAAAAAARLGTGVLSIRKSGKLPPPVLREEYTREYGAAAMEIPADGLDLRGRRIVIIDDVLATGGSLGAAARLLERTGAKVIAAAVIVELTALGGREAIAPLPVHSLSRA
jgi:adenine phosphoribosyltransferase